MERLEKERDVAIKLRDDRSPNRNMAAGKNASTNQLEGEDLIDFLESKLEDIEKRLAYSQGDYEDLQNDCIEI